MSRLLPQVQMTLDAASADGSVVSAALHDTLRNLPAGLRPSIEAALHGGKQLRPRLLQAWFFAAGGVGPMWTAPAAAIELVHRASLVHDDLPCMDAETERNGRPAVHVTYGSAQAVLTGDAMIALAFRTLGSAPHAAAMIDVLARTIVTMCAGQASEFQTTAHDNDDAWTACCDQKTGSLFSAACELGVIAACGDVDHLRNAARGFGLRLGRLYQLADDMTDGDSYPLTTARRTAITWHELEQIATAAPDRDPLDETLNTLRHLLQPARRADARSHESRRSLPGISSDAAVRPRLAP